MSPGNRQPGSARLPVGLLTGRGGAELQRLQARRAMDDAYGAGQVMGLADTTGTGPTASGGDPPGATAADEAPPF